MKVDKNPHKNELIRYRRRMGYSRKQVARLLGHKAPLMLARYERGVSFPPFVTALKLEILYRIPVAFLYADLYRQIKREVRDLEAATPRGRQQVLF